MGGQQGLSQSKGEQQNVNIGGQQIHGHYHQNSCNQFHTSQPPTNKHFYSHSFTQQRNDPNEFRYWVLSFQVNFRTFKYIRTTTVNYTCTLLSSMNEHSLLCFVLKVLSRLFFNKSKIEFKKSFMLLDGSRFPFHSCISSPSKILKKYPHILVLVQRKR